MFRPLCRGRVLFVPTDDPLAVGTELEFIFSLATGDPILRGNGTVVDPFAHGLQTGGYRGMAVELTKLGSDSKRTLDALHTAGEGTMPFGIPAIGGDGPRDRVKCTVARDPRLSVPQPISDAPSMTSSPAASPPPVPPPTPPLDPMPWSEERGDSEEPTEAEPPSHDDLAAILAEPPGPTPPVVAAPAALSKPLSRRGDPSRTEIVVDRRAPARTVLVASLAACLGLGGGYALWGLQGDDTGATSAVAVDEDAPSAFEAPAAVPTQPTAATAAAATAPCTARLSSDPPGAAIFVDGSLLGSTPYDGAFPCGKARFALRLPRYVNVDLEIEATAGEPVAVDEVLARPTRILRVVSKPRRAQVEVGGKKVGRTPVNVRVPGYESVEIVVRKRGFEPFETSVVPDRHRTVISAKLSR